MFKLRKSCFSSNHVTKSESNKVNENIIENPKRSPAFLVRANKLTGLCQMQKLVVNGIMIKTISSYIGLVFHFYVDSHKKNSYLDIKTITFTFSVNDPTFHMVVAEYRSVQQKR